MWGEVQVEVELFLVESGFNLTVANVKGQVQEDLFLGGICKVPRESREVIKFGFVRFPCGYALVCARPVPDTIAVVDVATVKEDEFTPESLAFVFMAGETYRGPHACWWSSHGGAILLFIKVGRELEGVILHDDLEGVQYVEGYLVTEYCQGGVRVDVRIHRSGITGKQAGCCG